MLRVGLTGGVASGKSTVGAMLAERGAHYLQADTLAHQLYAPGEPTYNAVVAHFGRDILNPDGTIHRGRLANVAFPHRIAELNAIVHPAVIAAQNRWMDDLERKDPGSVAVVEAALIVEAGAAKDFDKLIVVTCNLDQKIERYAQRAKISLDEARAEVLRRSAAQFSDEEKVRFADYIIDNSGSIGRHRPPSRRHVGGVAAEPLALGSEGEEGVKTLMTLAVAVVVLLPDLPAGCSCKASVGSRGAGFRRTPGVRQGRVKLHRAGRRKTADFGGCRAGCVLADRRIGSRLGQSRHGFVDASAYRSQRRPAGFLQRTSAYQ